jgi:hypothetical protein
VGVQSGGGVSGYGRGPGGAVKVAEAVLRTDDLTPSRPRRRVGRRLLATAALEESGGGDGEKRERAGFRNSSPSDGRAREGDVPTG